MFEGCSPGSCGGDANPGAGARTPAGRRHMCFAHTGAQSLCRFHSDTLPSLLPRGVRADARHAGVACSSLRRRLPRQRIRSWLCRKCQLAMLLSQRQPHPACPALTAQVPARRHLPPQVACSPRWQHTAGPAGLTRMLPRMPCNSLPASTLPGLIPPRHCCCGARKRVAPLVTLIRATGAAAAAAAAGAASAVASRLAAVATVAGGRQVREQCLHFCLREV